MKRMIVILASFLLALNVFAIEEEPNWKERYAAARQEALANFKGAKVGDWITVMRTIGGPLSGRITALTSNTVTIGTEKFEARSLTSDTCNKLFPEYCANSTKRNIDKERVDYQSRKQAELKRQAEERRLEAKRLEEEKGRLNEEAMRQHQEDRLAGRETEERPASQGNRRQAAQADERPTYPMPSPPEAQGLSGENVAMVGGAVTILGIALLWWLVAWLAIFVAPSLIPVAIARSKGRSGLGLFILSCLLTPLLPIVIACIMAPSESGKDRRRLSQGGMKTCPFCSEVIKRQARVCLFCKRDLPDEEPARMSSGRRVIVRRK